MIDTTSTKSIKLIADLCHNWGFASYQSAFLALVDALKLEKYLVTYTVNKVKVSGSLEVYVDDNGNKTKVFSKLDKKTFLDANAIKATVEEIKGMK